MKDYDRMNPISARRAIQDWLMDIKNHREAHSIGNAMKQAYGTSKRIKRQIAEVIDCQTESPTWIDVRRITSDSNVGADSNQRPTRQSSYEPVITDSLVRTRNVLRSIVEERNVLS